MLDLARRQARVGDAVADLSDREFRLLHHLADAPGRGVSRERLLSEVWGYHFDPGSNVVDVCVRRLRKKLGAERADRDRPPCRLSPVLRHRIVELAWFAFAAANLAAMLAWPDVGDDPVSLHLGQPDAALRLPGLARHWPTADVLARRRGRDRVPDR